MSAPEKWVVASTMAATSGGSSVWRIDASAVRTIAPRPSSSGSGMWSRFTNLVVSHEGRRGSEGEGCNDRMRGEGGAKGSDATRGEKGREKGEDAERENGGVAHP